MLAVEVSITRRSGGLLHAVLAATGLIGIALVLHGDLSTARLVTLFLVTTMFVGQVDMLARHLPDLQEGMGAVLRLRGMIAVPAEPVGGARSRTDRSTSSSADLAFSYGTGTFALRDVDLTVPAGHTCALVGRTGSGKSTLASLLSRAVEPPRGTVFLGGTDVRDLDLQQLRAAVGVVTQRTEVLAGSLADNITPLRRRPARARSRPRSPSSASPTGWPACPRGSTPCSAPAAPASRPARSSWSPSPACWCATSASSSSTRPPPAWTPSPRRAWCAPPTG